MPERWAGGIKSGLPTVLALTFSFRYITLALMAMRTGSLSSFMTPMSRKSAQVALAWQVLCMKRKLSIRAMNITGLKVQFANGEMDKLFAGFGDAGKPAEYARNSIAACIQTGIISGRNGNLIAPKDNITRAEVAVIVRKLLQKSNLI